MKTFSFFLICLIFLFACKQKKNSDHKIHKSENKKLVIHHDEGLEIEKYIELNFGLKTINWEFPKAKYSLINNKEIIEFDAQKLEFNILKKKDFEYKVEAFFNKSKLKNIIFDLNEYESIIYDCSLEFTESIGKFEINKDEYIYTFQLFSVHRSGSFRKFMSNLVIFCKNGVLKKSFLIHSIFPFHIEDLIFKNSKGDFVFFKPLSYLSDDNNEVEFQVYLLDNYFKKNINFKLLEDTALIYNCRLSDSLKVISMIQK